MNRYAVSLVVIAAGLLAIFFYARQESVESGSPELTKMVSMPADIDLSTTRLSYLKKYIVSVASNLDPVAINQMHSWQMLVKTADGGLVNDAKVTLVGGMPMHQHGMPTAPRMTKKLGEGQYLVEGMKFSMAGWWEIKIKVDAEPGPDNVTFNFIFR